jgi:CHAT domain-containing protein
MLGQVVNPTRDLPFAECEATGIRAKWRAGRGFPLRAAQATPERVLPLFEQTDVLHFAGHGAFDPADPLRSRLLCARGQATDVITLLALLESVPAARARVVLLSACETGRVVAGDVLNDQLGLPGGLLVAGTSAVVATHWSAEDLSASLVMSRCIEAWERGSIDLECALAEAQAWVREKATAEVVRTWIREQIETHGDLGPDVEAVHDELVGRKKDELIFASPLYWAPFHVTGRSVRLH